MSARAWVEWVGSMIAIWVIYFCLLDFWVQWQQRRRPVRDRDGRWRMP